MPIRQTTYILALFFFTPFLTLGQKTVKPRPIDLSNRTFIIGEKIEAIKNKDDYHTYFIFYKDGKAIYRGTRGDVILKDSPVGWQLVGDTLSLLPGSFIIRAEGKTQMIERDAIRHFIKKTPTGYLLQDKSGQMLLTEVK